MYKEHEYICITMWQKSNCAVMLFGFAAEQLLLGHSKLYCSLCSQLTFTAVLLLRSVDCECWTKKVKMSKVVILADWVISENSLLPLLTISFIEDQSWLSKLLADTNA